MDLLAFIRTADPTKVRIGERQRGEDEPKLLDTTVGCTVALLPVAPARAQSELDASVDRLFDEEGSGNEEEPHDSVDGDQSAGTLVVSEAAEVVGEDKLRDDYGGPGRPSVSGKSRSAIKRLLAGAVLNAKVRGGPVPTLPFVTSSVSATLERKDEHLADSVTGLNLRTICALQRFVISSDSSHHSGANIAEAEVDSIARSAAPIIATVVTATVDVTTTTREAPAKPSLFVNGSSSAGRTDPAPARQISLSAEVRMRTKYNIKEKRRLKAVVEEKDMLLKTKAMVKVKEQEAADSDALVTAVKLQNDSLINQVHALEVSSARLQEKVTAYEKFIDHHEKFQDDKIKEVNDKLEKLDADVVAMLAIAKCLNSTEYVSALGAAIGKAIEKGMQEGLSAGITHGIEGRALTDIAAYNPSAEADYLAALHRL
ncbi:hypothetical protein Tco_0268955 [Tanacetum coccineum]